VLQQVVLDASNIMKSYAALVTLNFASSRGLGGNYNKSGAAKPLEDPNDIGFKIAQSMDDTLGKFAETLTTGDPKDKRYHGIDWRALSGYSESGQLSVQVVLGILKDYRLNGDLANSTSDISKSVRSILDTTIEVVGDILLSVISFLFLRAAGYADVLKTASAIDKVQREERTVGTAGLAALDPSTIEMWQQNVMFARERNTLNLEKRQSIVAAHKTGNSKVYLPACKIDAIDRVTDRFCS
jgi:hypothetical protein